MYEPKNEAAKDNGLAATVKLIASLGERTKAAESKAESTPTIVELYGRYYLYRDGRLTEIDQPEPLREYYPEAFEAFTLGGLVNWIKADTDRLFTPDKPKAMVVVTSPTTVRVFSEAKGARQRRILLASCQYQAPDIPLDHFVDSEELFVNIQTCFLQDECRDIVLKIVNNLVEEQAAQFSDDGISQRVTIKSGIQEVDKTIFKNPAYLAPMRTFTEVAQPYSAFIVRFKEGKQAALFQADGGKWKVEAVKAIGKYLTAALDGTNTVVIA